MSLWRLEVALVALVLGFSTAAIHGWFRKLPSPHAVAAEGTRATITPMPDLEDLEEAASEVTKSDPFRISREPASVAFGIASQQQEAAPSAPRPILVLRGIVGGPPWQAIIDGIPGTPAGSVLKAGATFDKYVIRSVSKDTVIVRGPDTTWHLTLGHRGAQ
jgi:hypothetical protein